MWVPTLTLEGLLVMLGGLSIMVLPPTSGREVLAIGDVPSPAGKVFSAVVPEKGSTIEVSSVLATEAM